MTKKASDLIAANVNRLVKQARLSNLALQKKTGGHLTRSTIDRVRRAHGSAGIDSVEKIANAFGLDLWQLCVEDLDPERPPALAFPLSSHIDGLADNEEILLAAFRQLSPAFQQLVLNDLDRYLEAERQANDKKRMRVKVRA
jgi:transcriptional regulator with XRE-family HTH domain